MENEKNSLELSSSSILNITKSDISTMVADFVVQLRDGDEDPVKALIAVKKGLEFFTQLDKSVRQVVNGKIKLQKGESLSMYNAEITEKESGVKYDYSYCKDSEWDYLTSLIDPLIEKRKARENFLKNIRKELIDEDTGEIIQPPLRTGALGYQISIKK